MVRREEELRRSPEVQKLYMDAETRDDTDWIGVTMVLRQQVVEEFGFTGPDRFSYLEYAARRYGAFYVKQNLAKRCELESGDEFACDDVEVYHLRNQCSLSLRQGLQESKQHHLLVAGSIS